MNRDPVLTRQSDGHVTVEWPDPPQRSYEVAHEIVQQMVDTHNRCVDLWRSLRDLVAYMEADHRCTIVQHGHDCYELWKVEQEHARRLLEDWQP